MNREAKSVHDFLWTGNQITVDNENVFVEESIVFGSKTFLLAELKTKNNREIVQRRAVNIITKKIVNHTNEELLILGLVEALIKQRLMNQGEDEPYIYKGPNYGDKFEDLCGRITNTGGADNSASLFYNNHECALAYFGILSNRGGEGVLAFVTKENFSQLLIDLALYTEIVFEAKITSESVKYIGNIVRIESLKTGYLLYIHPYSMEIMQATRLGRISCENGINTFKLMDFLINSADSDINGIMYPGKESEKICEYIVAGVIRNLNIRIDDFVIGAVRFNKTIDLSQQFENELKKIQGNKTIVWVNVKGKTFYDAYKNAKELFYVASDLLSFAIKCDTYNDWYGTDYCKSTSWDMRSHTPDIEMDNLFFIENCLQGENLTFIDKNKLTPTEIQLNTNVGELFEKDWIDDYFKCIEDNKQDILRLRYAMKWIIQAWHVENPYDRLIYCSMALEFIVNGEKGNNIFNEYAIKNGRKLFSKSEKRQLINSIVDKVGVDGIDGLSEETIEQLNQSIRNIIGDSLSQASFNTKLESLIKRLRIPVSEEENNLLLRARKSRNSLIHGIKMEAITTLETKKLCGVTSRILAFKIIDKMEVE